MRFFVLPSMTKNEGLNMAVQEVFLVKIFFLLIFWRKGFSIQNYRFVNYSQFFKKALGWYRMKKFIITSFILMAVFGCSKDETAVLEKKQASAEKGQAETKHHEELGFIKNEDGFIVHMKDIKVLLKHLSASIHQQDWEAIKKDTKKLKNSSPVAFTGANKKDLPVEFINLDVKFHMSALELISACQEKNKDKATSAFFKVVNSCDECHAKYNPKEESTSWFQ